MKVCTILGTRPDIIKLSEIMKKFDVYFEHIIVYTGQNYDPNLSEIFFEELNLRQPNYRLNAYGSVGETIAQVIVKCEELLLNERPDAVVILGDTNSALASIIVKRLKIPLFHLEAGNRCFNDNVPEEINRRLIDHIADINLVFSEYARRNLLQEGLRNDRIFLMGSPMREILAVNFPMIIKNKIVAQLELRPKKFYLVSLHREENINIVENLIRNITAINLLAKVSQSPVIFSAHPRTIRALEGVRLDPNIQLHRPFGFFDYCKLQISAHCVISDSGTVAEESALLNFPAVTLRQATERPEAIEAGSLVLTSPEQLVKAVSLAVSPNATPLDYTVENCSERVAKIVQGYSDYIKRVVYV